MLERLEDHLLWDVGADVTPKYLGGDLVLLLGLSDSRVEQMLIEENHDGAPMFHSLEKWSPILCSGFRLTGYNAGVFR